jgi:hypothetical protein
MANRNDNPAESTPLEEPIRASPLEQVTVASVTLLRHYLSIYLSN